jgi:hypothetical protein
MEPRKDRHLAKYISCDLDIIVIHVHTKIFRGECFERFSDVIETRRGVGNVTKSELGPHV